MTISVKFRADFFRFFGVIVTLKIKLKYTRVSFCTSVQFFAKK